MKQAIFNTETIHILLFVFTISAALAVLRIIMNSVKVSPRCVLALKTKSCALKRQPH